MSQQGPNRFIKAALIGGGVGGFVSALPILNILNCCFCLLNMGGAALAVSMYLKENPNERLNNQDAALCGGIAGAFAGLVASLLGLIMNLIAAPLLAAFYRSLPPDIASKIAMSSGWGIIGIPVNIALYGAFGALGGFLAMQLFFKDRAAAS
jgi:hypothetical protein